MNHPTLWGQSSSAAGQGSGCGAALCRVAAATYPAYGPCDLSLIYSPLLLKLPVLRPQNR